MIDMFVVCPEPSAAKDVKAEAKDGTADSVSSKSSGKEEEKMETAATNEESDEPVLTIRPEIGTSS